MWCNEMSLRQIYDTHLKNDLFLRAHNDFFNLNNLRGRNKVKYILFVVVIDSNS